METKHTPGPWETPGEDGGERVICYQDSTGKRRTLAHVYDGEEFGSMEANARLIAAAPELLAALQRSLNWLSSYSGDGALGAYEQARAAIAKASGR